MNGKILMMMVMFVSITVLADEPPCEVVIRNAGPTWTEVQANAAPFKTFGQDHGAVVLEETRFETSQMFYNERSLAKRKPQVADLLRADMKPFLDSPEVKWTEGEFERTATMPAKKIVFKVQGLGVAREFATFVTQQNKTVQSSYFSTISVKCSGEQKAAL
jgi:hypothetical protein